MIFHMAEDADTKAKRRKRIRESYAPPLNQIALRHVDSVQALSESQRAILVRTLQKAGLRRLADCLVAIKKHGERIEDEDGLIGLLESSNKPPSGTQVVFSEIQDDRSEDPDHLARLLIQCYPDMPQTSASALVSSDVMTASLRVVAATRHALEDAKSDFVITVLHALFEERLHAITQIINKNPAFVKAIQRSRPDWNTRS
jgi:hypothetical protein